MGSLQDMTGAGGRWTESRRIEQLYAFLAEDPADGIEGVVSFTEDSVVLPLVGADVAMVEKLRPVARQIGAEMGVKITLARFDARTDLEEL